MLSDSHIKTFMKYKPLAIDKSGGLKIKGSQIAFKVAETIDEKESAYRLVYEEYVKRGFVSPSNEQIFTSIYQLLPNTTTYVGKINEEVILTLTAIADSPIKLPMDDLFPDLLDKLRNDKRQLAEFNILAVKTDVFKHGSFAVKYRNKMASLFSLFRLSARHMIRTHAVTDIVICVPPFYDKLYQYLCFETIGEPRRHKNWNNKSMIPLRLNLEKVRSPRFAKQACRLCLWRYFFRVALPKNAYIRNGRLSRSDIQTLFQERSSLLKQMGSSDTERLFRSFPTLKEKITSLSN
jgi:hypothetical protein